MSRIAFWENRRVLVGGGCGFLGSYLVPELVRAGASVTVVDDLSTGTLDHLDTSGDNPAFVKGDLSDRDIALEVTRGQDVLVNLAARAYGMDYSRSHDGEMLVMNLLCTLVPLDAARANGMKRVLIPSSSCVYADDAPVPTPELPVFDGLPESVNEGYGWAKRVHELAAAYYARDHGMNVSIVRPFNPYGGHYRWISEEKAHVIPALVKRILDGHDPVVVWGSGNQRRNFIHATDAVALMMKVVEKGAITPVNIGYEDTVTIRELVGLICEAAGVSPRVVFDTSKPEGRVVKSADSTLLRKISDDYEPKVSLHEGISEMIEWYERSFGTRTVNR